MDYLPVQDFSDRWGLSKRRIQILCKEGRIDGARMIGNMWALPEKAERPSDARIKSPVADDGHSVANVRKELKKLLKLLYKRCGEIGIHPSAQRAYVLTAIAGGMCSFYMASMIHDDIYAMIYKDIAGCDLPWAMDPEITDRITRFLDIYTEDRDVDNILSWAYQYSNKIIKDHQYSQTQFFTERYMITYLVDHIPDFMTAEKILDPCSGGGNFLAECLERLCKETKDRDFKNSLLRNAEKLYGFDIDRNITNIAVVNIRLRAFSILKRNKIDFDIGTWNAVKPNLYKTESTDSIEGSLAVDKKKVIHVITGESTTIAHALGDSDIVLTNPPFATIKGMAQEQKDFLKQYYPDANCDTCVAFLEAIQNMIKSNGFCGMVTQNAWMHLKSFQTIRSRLTSKYAIYKIINLGSGAFQDLSGEKSNVSLIIFGNEYQEKNLIDVLNLTQYPMNKKIKILQEENQYVQKLQDEINGPNGYDLTEKETLKKMCQSEELYKDIAVPMQGTSTGNAKELVGYFWEHFCDDEWISVSNGGGYCRWQGLNDKVVRWGKDGEYIKKQKGSALRNVKYFPETQMVYSDTGTAGLNVRVLLDDQIFIASGPGIRITKGNEYAHMALLNSRLASYYLRMISPKLTLAAGYIGQIPVNESVYSSVVLEKNARMCVEIKAKMLSMRPNNLEYDGTYLDKMPANLDKASWSQFNEDITNELLKLEIESKIDRYLSTEYGFSKDDESQLNSSVGECAYFIQGADDIELSKLDPYISKITDAACCLKRTRTSKNALGCDGIIEYISKDLNINPEIIVKKIQERPDMLKTVLGKYKDMLLHNEALYYMGYTTKGGIKRNKCSLYDITGFLSKRFGDSVEYGDWISSSFNRIHNDIFKGVPFLIFKNGEIHRYDNNDKRSNTDLGKGERTCKITKQISTTEKQEQEKQKSIPMRWKPGSCRIF